MSVSIAGLDKAEVLAALYNASRPQGMGFLQYDPKPMTVEEARSLLSHESFDYLKGRVMKISLKSDDLNTWGYDRDNGEGKAAQVITELRKNKDVNTASIQASHKLGVLQSAQTTLKSCDEEDSVTEEVFGGIKVKTFTLGMSDVKDEVLPKVEEALKANK